MFSLHQRWSSQTEPELGPGTVIKTGNGRVTLNFPGSSETRMYAAASAPLLRVRFKNGDSIIDVSGRSGIVTGVETVNHLFVYDTDSGTIRENDLGIVTVTHGPEDRLLAGDLDSKSDFELRRQTLELDYQRRKSPVRGFVGGRIDLIPHQLYIAGEVSSRFAPRVLLSDEVGLGKTIEACLILHRLLLAGRVSRVLILVPESLVHQWFVEVLRRFNLWVNIYDEERCAAIESGSPDGNPFLDDQLIVCSIEFLAGSEKRAAQAVAATWDMLIVDEAHHLTWSTAGASREYSIVELLSRNAESVLLLTATPEQLGEEAHFARLRLLDPDRYNDFSTFLNESADYSDAAKEVDRLMAVQPATDESIANVNRLLDLHGPGRVLFRNTRSAMTGFPKRIAHLTEIPAIGAKNPKLLWLIDTLREFGSSKVLLICRSKADVLKLETAIRDVINLNVGIFHEDLTLVQRDRNAAWFAEESGAQILLCSEIGSEGRNFQFAHHLVLYDLPSHPELLEQRIGRLDRIGQTNDIHIHVPYLAGTEDEILARWYHEGLNAFEKNLVGGNLVYEEFGSQIATLALGTRGGQVINNTRLQDLVSDTRDFHRDLSQRLAEGRDRLIELNSFRPREAANLVEAIQSEDESVELETFMMTVFEEFAVEAEDLAPRTYALHVRDESREAFPSIPEDGISITFDRKRALSREDISFLTWDHPMVTGAIDMIVGSGFGTSSVGQMTDSGNRPMVLDVTYMLESVAASYLNLDKYLPPKPINIQVDHGGRNLTGSTQAKRLLWGIRGGNADSLLENEVITGTIIPRMIEAAQKVAEEQANTEKTRALTAMKKQTDDEIQRLEDLSKKNPDIRADEIQLARDHQEELADAIASSRIRMDSIRLLRAG